MKNIKIEKLIKEKQLSIGASDRRGYMTIEASIVIPIIIMGIFVCLFGLILVYERSYILSEEYKALYTIPLVDIRNKEVDSYLNSQDYVSAVVLGSADVEGGYSKPWASCSGILRLFGTHNIDASREIDVRVDRLRRWQFYGDTYEEYGD